ncbi:uncharacterized protein [Atheta coriaria]|uniref:uncharacterized protein isoform X2 n=1 Tax=Dalotia coriaria TaxID=877792 RepID=UPI0031F36473
MKISASVSPAEHWLTLMNCTMCKRTPEASPIYRCNYGHALCYSCFQQLISQEAIPVCRECGSEHFTRQDVSDDFLRKLKIKPGIGRPCRYVLKPDQPSLTLVPTTAMVTIEQLFQLPTHQIKELFQNCTKEKLNYLKQLSATEGLTSKLASLSFPHKAMYHNRKLTDADKSFEALQSRKPLRCPHDMCNKIVAISSFKAHYKYEHFNFKKYNMIRGNELCIPFDPAVLQHGKSICLGIISMFPNPDDPRRVRSDDELTSHNSMNIFDEKNEVDTFWLMTTGSQSDNPQFAYILLWLFTTNEDVVYNSTIELTSEENTMTMTTFCKVNKIYESQCINEVMRRQNCLYLAYTTMRSMLMYGSTLMFRMTIH